MIVLFCLTTWATEEFICEEKAFSLSNFLNYRMDDDILPFPYSVYWEIYQKPYSHSDTYDSDDFDEQGAGIL